MLARKCNAVFIYHVHIGKVCSISINVGRYTVHATSIICEIFFCSLEKLTFYTSSCCCTGIFQFTFSHQSSLWLAHKWCIVYTYRICMTNVLFHSIILLGIRIQPNITNTLHFMCVFTRIHIEIPAV